MRRPNILLIMGDEHTPTASGPYGHPQVRTPALDRLASEGAVFERAYCNSPLCVPSRMSMLTGRYAHRIGVFDLASPLSSGTPTFMHSLRCAGYDAALAGKQHFVGPDQLHGFRIQLARDIHANANPLRPWPAVEASERWPHPEQAGPGRTRYIEVDDEVEAASVHYVEEAARLDSPWFLCSSFIAPHWPYVVPEPYWDAYHRELVDLPDIPEGHLENQHPVIRQLRASLGVGGYSEDAVRRARAAYLGLVTMLDDRIGRLLDTLDRTGQRDNTVVIYTSDHGGMLGEHGLWRKANFYEESVRVPLLMRWPGCIDAGVRVRELVSLVDIAPTLTAIVGGPRLPGEDGADLIPVVRGEQRRELVFSEYFGPGCLRRWPCCGAATSN